MTTLVDELKVMLHGVWQRRWLAMAIAWAICVLGWLVVSLIPNSYEARARVMVAINDVVGPDAGNPLDSQRRFDQLKDSISSARNLEQVVVASGMIDRTADDSARAAAAAGLQGKVTVAANPNNIVDISVVMGGGGRSDAENAALSARVVEAIIAQLRDSQIRDGAADAQQNIRFLDTQISEIQTKLTQAESARTSFEARNLGVLPGAGSPAVRIEAARSEMAQIDAQLVSVSSQLAATPPTIAGGVGATGVSAARQQLASAEAELAGLRARGLTAAHPDVIAYTSQIATLRAQVAREPSSGGGGVQNPAYAGLVGQRAALSQRKGQLAAEIARINSSRIQEPAAAAEYDRLNRDYTVLKDQYDRLVARREQVRLVGAAESNADAVRIQVLDPPSTPSAPSKPNKPLLLFAVLFAGLGGGAAAAFALSQLQTTYPTAERLAKASGLPVLGSVTEILTEELRASRLLKLKRFAMAGGALAGLCVLLLAVELVQRGTVG